MALFDDEIVLSLGGDKVQIVENYEVRSGILVQPAAFSLRLGNGGVLADILARYPEQTPFQLTVNDQVVQTGYTDGMRTSGAGGNELTFDGRDVLGKVVSAYAPADKTFSNATYLDLTTKILTLCGFNVGGSLPGQPEVLLFADDIANRKAISGTVITATENAEVEVTKRTESGAVEATDGKDNSRKSSYRSATVKVGKRWYEFLKTQLDRAGLFLWAAGEGAFVLSFPTANQTPAYQITRINRNERGLGTVVNHTHRRDTTERYTKVIVYGRGGGRKAGRNKIRGEWVDAEMSALFGGDDRKLFPIHDNEVTTITQAEFFARRKLAELNREGWELSYELSGHSTVNAHGDRAVWTPNTVVSVDDHELGITGNFWVESVSFLSTPQHTTQVRLMRPQDMFWATDASA